MLQLAEGISPAPRGTALLRLEAYGIAILAAAVAFYVGMVAIGAHQTINWDGLSALAHAYDILFKEPSINFALVGFVEPPAPALAYLPFVAVASRAAQTGMPGPAFGAVMLGIASLLLCGFGQALRLPRWLRIPIVLIVILHPVTLSYAAMGSPLVLLLVAVIGIAKSLAAWGDHGRLRDLIGCSLYCAVACLARYEAVFLVAAAAVYIGIRSGMGREGGYSRVEGLLITFLLPVIYFGGLWIGANWLIMGDPWHFVRGLGGGAAHSTDAWQAAVLTLPLLVFPFCYVLAYHELRPFGPWRGGAAAALLFATAVALPMLWPTLFRQPGGSEIVWASLGTLAVTALAVGPVLAMGVAARYLHAPAEPKEHRSPLVGTLVLTVATIVLLIAVRPLGGVLPATATDVFRGHVAFAHSATEEQRVAQRLANTMRPGMHATIVGWPGFAIALYADQTRYCTVLPHERPDVEVAKRLRPGDVLLLIGQEGGWRAATAPNRLEREWASGNWTCYRVHSP